MKSRLKIFFSLVLVLAVATQVAAQKTDHWETIIQPGAHCKYFIPTSEIGANWKQKDFAESGWIAAKSGVGFGDNDDNTVISKGISSLYMRFNFDIHDISAITSLVLDFDYDDGFIAYLNGIEIARDNVPNPVSWDMELNDLHEAALYLGKKPERFLISETHFELLKNGKNVLAIEVHNESASSSDLTSNVFLHAGISTSEKGYNTTPHWFWEPTILGGFNLPLMIINTGGQQIPDEPRIIAEMGLIYNGEGNTNAQSDNWNEYSGRISIERRGNTSQGFKKKSYSIELQNEDGSNNNVSILGLPEENDFVLYGPYSDKTMVKNVLTYELFRRTGRWAPRTRYIEMILNNDYRGIYVLTEKLKRDENRVDIDKLTEDDISSVDISGGYILRRDKKDELTFDEYWTSPVGQPYHEQMWYEYFDPKYDELTYEQSEYIQGWMEEFDNVMSGYNFADPENGYKKYIRTKSFIDMMFINEISKGIDNYMFSTYFFKENDEDGGQLNAGPPWDYNIGYGNVNYGEDWDAAETYGWGYPQGSRTYWFERLMEDPDYQNKVYCRWTKFRNSIYSDESVVAVIDSCVEVLGNAVDRNYEKYPILGEYFWPAIYWPYTYEEEVEMLKTWLIDRLEWMDDEWYNLGDDCMEDDVKTTIAEADNFSEVKVFPNPSNFQNITFQILLNEPTKFLTIAVFSLQGETIQIQTFKPTPHGLNKLQLSNLSYLTSGVYIYKIYSSSKIIETGKIHKL